MLEAAQVKCTGIVGGRLWGLDHGTGMACVWDQGLARWRIPTHQEQMGVEAHNKRSDKMTGRNNPKQIRTKAAKSAARVAAKKAPAKKAAKGKAR